MEQIRSRKNQYILHLRALAKSCLSLIHIFAHKTCCTADAAGFCTKRLDRSAK